MITGQSWPSFELCFYFWCGHGCFFHLTQSTGRRIQVFDENVFCQRTFITQCCKVLCEILRALPHPQCRGERLKFGLRAAGKNGAEVSTKCDLCSGGASRGFLPLRQWRQTLKLIDVRTECDSRFVAFVVRWKLNRFAVKENMRRQHHQHIRPTGPITRITIIQYFRIAT